jgi:cytochrome c-type biogenesis protein CcmH/NrfF
MACVFVRSIVLQAVLLFASAAAASPSLNPDVRQDTIASTICSPGYTSLVRPASVYTNGVKLKLVRNAGQDEAAMADYELDHIVPLALGGHPRALDNLQLQPWSEARRKDRIEVKLQCLVCAGQITLPDAQTAIATDWEAAYHAYASVPCHRHRAPEPAQSTDAAQAANTTEANASAATDPGQAPAWLITARIWWPFHQLNSVAAN